MQINIINNYGVTQVIGSSPTPKSYYGKLGKSGKFYPYGDDKFLIILGEDSYEVLWTDLLINNEPAASFSNAASLLAEIFSNNPPIPPPPQPNLTLKIDNSADFNVASDGSFTIEWFAKIISDNNHPRPWSIGSWPSAAHAVSIENGNFYYWINGSLVYSYDISSLPFNYIDYWTHFCLMRYKSDATTSEIGFYVNGFRLGSLIYNPEIPTNGYPLYLGSEGNDSIQNGLMSNFRWDTRLNYDINGFAPPTSPLNPNVNTLLLIFQGDSLPLEITNNGGNTYTITNGSGIYNSDNPFPGVQGSISFGI